VTNDPRPLVGQPLALDLINTEWADVRGHHDLLGDMAGLKVWLRSSGQSGPVDTATLAALREARSAIRGVVEQPGDAKARAALNSVLAHGAWAERLGPQGPERVPACPEVHWTLAWTAAATLLYLLREEPERVRRCSGPDCLLAFYDTSRSGRRQWCSMAICGNRAKARRHYHRSRT
jgi:predicted RNA-binding Zn ribbon-like protein